MILEIVLVAFEVIREIVMEEQLIQAYHDHRKLVQELLRQAFA